MQKATYTSSGINHKGWELDPLKYVGLCFDPLKVHYVVYLCQFSYINYLVRGILSTKIRIKQLLSI